MLSRDVEKWREKLLQLLDGNFPRCAVHVSRHARHLGLHIADCLYDSTILKDMEMNHFIFLHATRHPLVLFIIGKYCVEDLEGESKIGLGASARHFVQYAKQLLRWPSNLPDIITHSYRMQLKAM
eukprot:3773717-Amphidinium_carterae.1